MSPDVSPAAGETIGQRLKRLRLERGLSQRELAAPGVSYAYISRIEAGTRQPSVKALRRLAGKLGITADYLETGSDLDKEDERELRLADLELAIRLGETGDAEVGLHELVAEAAAAGDRATGARARVALAELAHERGDFGDAVGLLEAAVTAEIFDPVGMVDVYSQLARAYASAGRTRDAVQLLERCLAEVVNIDDVGLEARYATLLSYALSDLGDVNRAEDVVRHAIERTEEVDDPYVRVRLYWSMARLAHTEGRAGVALTNVRKAIALLQATDDTLHLGRANLLAASISLSRGDADVAARYLDQAELLLGAAPAADDIFELRIRRSRLATLRGDAATAVQLAREAIPLTEGGRPADEGLAFSALADALVLSGETKDAQEAFRRAVALLEQEGRWRDATNTCRSWARMLTAMGRDDQAVDVLERATALAMRATPDALIER